MKISLMIKDAKREYNKPRFTLRDNMAAVKFSMKQDEFYAKEERTPEEFETLQLQFAEMIVELFGSEFTVDDLLDGLDIKNKKILEEVFIEALGGKEDDSKK